MSDVVVFGGYGTFGGLVSRELARLGVAVTVAGRDGERAKAFAADLAAVAGRAHVGVAADVMNAASLRATLAGKRVAVSCAGPFSILGSALLEACLDVGCHYADIADDRSYTELVRQQGPRFRERGLCAVYGCSSLPAISGALALVAVDGVAAKPKRARITLCIGNDNPKGAAAIRSAVELIGRAIAAPQGTLIGFRDGERIPLPPPFGKKTAYNFESPEYDLFPSLLGVTEVSVKVAFELRAVSLSFSLLSRFSSSYGERSASMLESLGRMPVVKGLGCSGGAVMTELFYPDGVVRRAALSGAKDGQRLAALPCAFAAEHLANLPAGAPATRAGALTAYELLGARPIVDRMVHEGFTLTLDI